MSTQETTVQRMPLDCIIKSATNPRKTTDKDSLDGLAASIKEHGILSPLLARPGKDGQVELVCGSRRLAAAALLNLETVPVIVRVMDDTEAAECQIIENLQREDVHPLEESDAFVKLAKGGITTEDLAAKVGKSVSYVLQRLALTGLTEKARKAFYEGIFTAASALLVARVPSPKDQDALVKWAREYDDGNPPTVNDVFRYLHQHLMLEMSKAVFDVNDAKLVAKAGACSTCPKRTGCNRALFADLEDDYCTDEKCWQEKTKLHVKYLIKNAKELKIRVLSDEENGHAYHYSGSELAYNSSYVDAEKACDLDPKRHAFKDLLTDTTKVLAFDRDGTPHYLYDKSDALKELQAKHEWAKPKKGAMGSRGAMAEEQKQRDERRADKRKLLVGKAAALIALGQVADAVVKTALPDELLLQLAMANINHTGYQWVIKRRGLEKPKQPANGYVSQDQPVKDLIKAMANPVDKRALAVELLCVGYDAYAAHSGFCEPLQAAAKALGVDLKQCMKDAAAANPEKKPKGALVEDGDPRKAKKSKAAKK